MLDTSHESADVACEETDKDEPKLIDPIQTDGVNFDDEVCHRPNGDQEKKRR
jgi:hypothetical protein